MEKSETMISATTMADGQDLMAAVGTGKKSLPSATNNEIGSGGVIATSTTTTTISKDPDPEEEEDDEEDYDDEEDEEEEGAEDDDEDDDDDEDNEDDIEDNPVATAGRTTVNDMMSTTTVVQQQPLTIPANAVDAFLFPTTIKSTAMIMPPSYDSIFNIHHAEPAEPLSNYWPLPDNGLLSSSSSSSMILTGDHHHHHQSFKLHQQQPTLQPNQLPSHEIDSSYDSEPDSEMQKIVQDVVDSGNSTTPEQETDPDCTDASAQPFIQSDYFLLRSQLVPHQDAVNQLFPVPSIGQQQHLPLPLPPADQNQTPKRGSGTKKKRVGRKRRNNSNNQMKSDGQPPSQHRTIELAGHRHEEVDRTASETLSQEYLEYVTHAMITGESRQQQPPMELSPHQRQLFEAKLLFAKKRGYTETEVKRALDKLGYECQQNELLEELIKISSVNPGPNSLLAAATGSSNSKRPLAGSISSSVLITTNASGGNRSTVGKTLSSPVTGLSSSSSTSATGGCGGGGSSSAATSGRSSSSNQYNNNNNGQIRATELRSIVIDGSNVAMCHGKQQTFSCRGIEICVEYFRSRGHQDITIFVPLWRKYNADFDLPIKDRDILLKLEDQGVLFFTPARNVSGRMVASYDDRYILNHAVKHESVIVSNDQYRDLITESSDFKRIVDERLLMYVFVGDEFIPPDDPMGAHGPKLNKFLSKPLSAAASANSDRNIARFNQICPYDKKCTYGHKCKYFHPERQQQPPGTNNNQNKLKTSSNDLLHGSNNSLITATTTAIGGSSNTKLRLLKSLPLGHHQHQSTSNTNLSAFGASDSVIGNGTVHGKKPLFRTKSSVSIETDSTATAAARLLTKTNSVTVCLAAAGNNPSAVAAGNQMTKHKKLERQLTLNPDADPRLSNLIGAWTTTTSTTAAASQQQFSQLSNSMAALSAGGDQSANNRNFLNRQPSPLRTSFFPAQQSTTKPLMVKSYSLSGGTTAPATGPMYHHRVTATASSAGNSAYLNFNQDFNKGTATAASMAGMLMIDTGDHHHHHHHFSQISGRPQQSSPYHQYHQPGPPPPPPGLPPSSSGGLLSTTAGINDGLASFLTDYGHQKQQWPPIPITTDVHHTKQPPPSSTFESESFEKRRSKIYYHLSSLMPAEKVERAMRSMPTETDPKEICAAILKLDDDDGGGARFASATSSSSSSLFKP